MLPFKIGLFQVLFAAGLVAGIAVTLKQARRAGIQAAPIRWVLLVSLPFLFPGAKALYLAQYGFSLDTEHWFGSGMSLIGGLLAVFVVSFFVCWWIGLSWLALLNCLAPGAAFGIAIGRLGCYLEGCNGGTPADLPWAVTYPAGYPVFITQLERGLINPFATVSLPVHPTQLYEAGFLLAAGISLVLLSWQERRPGRLALYFLGWYASFRFLIEFIRSDAGGWHPLGFSFAQAMSVGILVCLGVVVVRGRLIPSIRKQPTDVVGSA